jgi:hypothetical protein
MFWNLLATALAVYFVKQEYENGRPIWLMVWSILLGWDIHTLLLSL